MAVIHKGAVTAGHSLHAELALLRNQIRCQPCEEKALGQRPRAKSALSSSSFK
jgi:hypothetical protein